MKPVSVSKAKASLSRYLSHVKNGEEIVVTERGTPVARIVPIRGRENRVGRIARLVRAGLVAPGKGGKWPFPAPTGAPSGALASLLKERAEGI